MGKVSQKKNLSSIQVMKTLQVLMQGDYSMNDLIEILNQTESEPVFNNSVISKYINTCRYCGLEIPKINNKYYLAKLPFGLDLSWIEIDLLNSIKNYVNDNMSHKQALQINSLVNKISRFSNKYISRTEREGFILSVELFERAIAKKRKIKLIFKNRDILECVPLRVLKEGEKTYFIVYKNYERKIETSRLSGLELLGQRYIDALDGDQVVVFKLKGGLANRYEARENERVENNFDGTITVTNKNEKKEVLFSRLLRYDDKCEILHPKGYREDMKDLINDMLKNYGVN